MVDRDALEWDEDLGFLLTVAENYMNNITDTSDRDLCRSWMDKLTGDEYVDAASKKRRNIYLTNLINSLERGVLDGPFRSPPPPDNLEVTQHAFSKSEQGEHEHVRRDAGDFNTTLLEGNTYVATKTLPDGRGAFGFVALSTQPSDLKLFQKQGVMETKVKIGENVVRKNVREKYTRVVRPTRFEMPPTPPNYSPTQMPIFSTRVEDPHEILRGIRTPELYKVDLSPIGTQQREMRSFGTPLPGLGRRDEPSLSFAARARLAARARPRPVDVTPVGVPVESLQRQHAADLQGSLIRRVAGRSARRYPARRIFDHVDVPSSPTPPERPVTPPERPVTPPARQVAPQMLQVTPTPPMRQAMPSPPAYEETALRRPGIPMKRFRGRARRIEMDDGSEPSVEAQWKSPVMARRPMSESTPGTRSVRLEDAVGASMGPYEPFIEEPSLPSGMQRGWHSTTVPGSTIGPAYDPRDWETPMAGEARVGPRMPARVGARVPARVAPRRLQLDDVYSKRETDESIVIEPSTPKRDVYVGTPPPSQQRLGTPQTPVKPKRTMKEKIRQLAPCLDKKHDTSSPYVSAATPPPTTPVAMADDETKIVLTKNLRETVTKKQPHASPAADVTMSRPEYWKQFEHVDVRKQLERQQQQQPDDMWGDIIRQGYERTAREKYALPETWNRYVDAPLERQHVETLNATYPKMLVGKFVELLKKQRRIIAIGKQKQFETDRHVVAEGAAAPNAEDLETRKQIKERYMEMKRVLDNVKAAQQRREQQLVNFGKDPEVERSADEARRAEDEMQKQAMYAGELRTTIQQLVKDHEVDMRLYEESILRRERENRRLETAVETLRHELSVAQQQLEDASAADDAAAISGAASDDASPVRDEEEWW